jgi:hypothetical protein
MHSIHRPDFDANPLQRKNCGTISNVPVGNAGLNRQNRHSKAFSAKIASAQALARISRPPSPHDQFDNHHFDADCHHREY